MWAKIPNLLFSRNISNSGKRLQVFLFPGAYAGTGSQAQNEVLHEDSVQEL